MSFTFGPALHDLAASGTDQAANAMVFAEKVKIGCAHPDPLRRSKPVKEQRPAKAAPLVVILDRDADLGMVVLAPEQFKNADDPTIGLDTQHDIRSGPVGNDPHRLIRQIGHEPALARDAPETQVMRPQRAAPVCKCARKQIWAWRCKNAGHRSFFALCAVLHQPIWCCTAAFARAMGAASDPARRQILNKPLFYRQYTRGILPVTGCSQSGQCWALLFPAPPRASSPAGTRRFAPTLLPAFQTGPEGARHTFLSAACWRSDRPARGFFSLLGMI